MSKRIKELAEQADEFANNWFPANTYNPDWQEVRDKKFAQLIVKECADYVACGEFGDAGLAEELKKHFGVK